jgi:hypothetical protein
MKLDVRWLIAICAELALMVAFLFFADAHSWSGPVSTWTLVAILVLATFFNELIGRRGGRIASGFGKRRRPTTK